MKMEYILAVQNVALAEVLAESPSFPYFYRKTCRQYSEKFNTPLPQVYSMPFDEVLRDVTEYRYEALLQSEDGEEDLIDIANRIIDPQYEEREERENEEFAKKAMEQENLKKARQIAKEMGFNKDKPQSLEVKESSPPKPAGNSKSFDDEIPPEAFDSPSSGLDDLF